jgi:protein O-mannosyl-transferase
MIAGEPSQLVPGARGRSGRHSESAIRAPSAITIPNEARTQPATRYSSGIEASRKGTPLDADSGSTAGGTMSTARNWRQTAILALLAIAAYIPALRAGFLWDDVEEYVVANPLIHAADGLFRFWFTNQPTDYYPLTNSLFWIEWRLWGMHPLGYHLVNILLHAVCVVLVWRLLRRLAVPGAWVAAALFAVHPVAVEAVAWISQTKTTLSTALLFGSILCFLDPKPGELGSTGAATGEPKNRVRLVASFLLFVAAVLAKTAAVIQPLVLLLCIAWRRRRVTLRDVLTVLPFLAVGIVLGLVAHGFQERVSGAAQFASEPFLGRLAAAGWSVWFYLSKALLPIGLSLVYPHWAVVPRTPLAWLPGLALVAVFIVAWRFRARWGAAVLFGLGYDVVALLPVLGFVGVGFMVHSRVADHWQYAALPGVIALAVGLVAATASKQPFTRQASRVPPAPRFRRGVIAIAIVWGSLCFVLTWHRTSQYVNEETIYRDTLAKNPKAWIIQYNLGQRLAVEHRLDEALPHLQAAVQLEPRFPDALLNLGNVLDDLGRAAEAEQSYARALQLTPDNPILHYNLGVALEKQGKFSEAVTHYATAVQLQPNDAETHRRLASVLSREGHQGEAAVQLRAVLRLEPADVESAARLAWILATSPDAGTADEALQLAQSVCAVTNNRDPGALDILAAAYARADRLDDATTVSRQAVALARAVGDSVLTARLEARLHEYESRQHGIH